MKNVVVFTGAGISAESGLQTFRDHDGLWEQYNVMEVATPEAWHKNPRLVLEFYNKRKEQILKAQPNQAHRALARLNKKFNVRVITQNIDDLHERGGAKNVLHLHGEIVKARSTVDQTLVYDYGNKELHLNDLCEKGSQLRPHVVWFGEPVPEMGNACKIVSKADILIVIGTSLAVYPAAGLIHVASPTCIKYIIDPKELPLPEMENMHYIRATACEGVPPLVDRLLSQY